MKVHKCAAGQPTPSVKVYTHAEAVASEGIYKICTKEGHVDPPNTPYRMIVIGGNGFTALFYDSRESSVVPRSMSPTFHYIKTDEKLCMEIK